MAESEVLQLAGVAGWETLRKHIEEDYFPEFETKIGRTRYWLSEDIQLWEAWREEKKQQRYSYKAWLESNDTQDFKTYQQQNGLSTPAN